MVILENLSYAECEGGIFLTIIDEIGRNSRHLRQGQGLTLEEVAFRANLSVNCLQSIEYGRSNATADTLIHIAQALNIDSQVFGVFARADVYILSEIRKPPRLPLKCGGQLQVCENIFLMRKERGMSQKQLADNTGISPTYLRYIEQGCANMTMRKLLSIADAFDITLMKLAFLAMPEEHLMKMIREAREKAGI